MDKQGYLVVHFDDSYTTISAALDATAPQICSIVAKRRNLNPQAADTYGLYVRELEDCSDSLLTNNDCPLEVQEALKKQGKLANFRFIFRELDDCITQPGTTADDDSEESDGEGGSIFADSSPCAVLDSNPILRTGYLEKRGKHHKAYRQRWFVLQPAKLFYFKTREAKAPQAHIPLEDVAVRELPGRKATEFVFELVTTPRVFQFKAQSYSEMQMWIYTIKSQCEIEQGNLSMDDIQIWMAESELERSNADDAVREQVSTLLGCLTNHVAQSAFMQFAVQTHCAENLLFWIDVEKYKEVSKVPGRDIVSLATKTMEEYLVIGAPHEISIEGLYRKNLVADIKAGRNINADTFSQLQNRTFASMETALFPRFMASTYFETALLFLNGTPARDLAFEDVAFKHTPIPLAKKTEQKTRARVKSTTRSASATSLATLAEKAEKPEKQPTLLQTASEPELSGGKWKAHHTIFDSVEDDDNIKTVESGSPPDPLFVPVDSRSLSQRPPSLFEDFQDESTPSTRRPPSVSANRNIHYTVSTPTDSNPLGDCLSPTSDPFSSSFTFLPYVSPTAPAGSSSSPSTLSPSPNARAASAPPSRGKIPAPPPSSTPKPAAPSSGFFAPSYSTPSSKNTAPPGFFPSPSSSPEPPPPKSHTLPKALSAPAPPSPNPTPAPPAPPPPAQKPGPTVPKKTGNALWVDD